jgi:nitronate monooxygenase
MGTRFMASRECALHPNVKELLVQTQETDTIMVERSIGMAARAIKTDFSLKVLEMETRGATLDELFPMISGTRSNGSYASGDINNSLLLCGQGVGSIHEIPSVKEIIDGIISEAKLIGQRLHNIGISV